MVTSYLVLVIVISAIFSFVVPKLAQSIQIFVGSLSGYLNNLQTWTNELLAYLKLDTLDLSSLKAPLQNLFDQVLAFLSDLGPHLLEFTSGLVSMVVTGVLALVFSIYMLSGKERLLSQCRRLLRAYVPPKFADPILDVVHLTGDTFTHFVTGQLIEACILGGLCSIGMLFIQPDYAPLIGVIIGSSALIPVAGALHRGDSFRSAAVDGLPAQGGHLPDLPGDPPADRRQCDLSQGGGHLHRPAGHLGTGRPSQSAAG